MTSEKEPVNITPETRVAQLLDAYPDLEDTLLDLSPTFAKLNNPVLRRTVARVTTLRQAARVGGISLGKLINELRTAAGISLPYQEENEIETAERPPDWFDLKRVSTRRDVRPILETGEQPIGIVFKDLHNLPAGEIYELTAPFVPAPLIDKAREYGFAVWWVEDKPDRVRVYFYQREANDNENASTLIRLD
jgi:hypothetical protein